jgi:hypothetical protein
MASLAMYSNLYDHEFYNGFYLHLNILGLTTVSDINSSKMIDLDFGMLTDGSTKQTISFVLLPKRLTIPHRFSFGYSNFTFTTVGLH